MRAYEDLLGPILSKIFWGVTRVPPYVVGEGLKIFDLENVTWIFVKNLVKLYIFLKTCIMFRQEKLFYVLPLRLP